MKERGGSTHFLHSDLYKKSQVPTACISAPGAHNMAKELKERVIGVALCGFGRAGRIHFNGIRQNRHCELKYVVDLPEVTVTVGDSTLKVGDVIRSTLAEYRMEQAKVVDGSKFHEVVEDPAVDAVVVATPTDTHEHYVKQALIAGKAVFCEKPIAGDIEDTAHCYDVAAAMGQPLYCAFQRRFDLGYSKIHRQVREGKLGKIHQVKTTSRDSPVPSIDYLKISHGMYHDCAVHDIDLICWVLDEEPEGVIAQGTTMDPKIAALGDVDTIAIILKFPSGALATINLSRHSSYGYDQRLEVYGEKGMLVCENATEDPVVSYNQDGVTSAKVVHSFPQRFEMAYRREMDEFIDVIRDPSLSLKVQRKDTLLTSRIVNACEKSAREGRMVPLEPTPEPQVIKN